jgi:hypothetical protein
MTPAPIAFAPVRSLHAGRRLRQPVRTGGRPGRVAPVQSGTGAPLRVITNSQIVGDELVTAIAFLSDALGLPALNPDADRTAKAIDLAALRRAAAA